MLILSQINFTNILYWSMIGKWQINCQRLSIGRYNSIFTRVIFYRLIRISIPSGVILMIFKGILYDEIYTFILIIMLSSSSAPMYIAYYYNICG